MVTVDPVIAKVIVAAAVVMSIMALMYKMKAPRMRTQVTNYRGRPRVITDMGIKTMKEVIPLSTNKYQVKYEEGDYIGTYTKTGRFDELIEVNPHQTRTGENPPVLIEYRLLMELAYSYEDAPTRELLKKRLDELTNDLTKAKNNDAVEELSVITKKLVEHPKIYTEVLTQLGQKTDERSKYESSLRNVQAGIDSTIARRAEQLASVASARAKRPEGRERDN